MGHWIQTRKRILAVHLQIAFLTLAVLAAAALLTYYANSLPR